LLECIAALDEPYRSIPLWRYFEDLSLEEIARRAWLPASTIRTRHQRGLARMREHLEAQQGANWQLAILPLLKPDLASSGAGSGSIGILGSVFMSMKVKFVVVTLALGLGVWIGTPLFRSQAREMAPGQTPRDIERGQRIEARGVFAEFVAAGKQGESTRELARTDSAGNFELKGLGEQAYQVSVYDPKSLACVRVEARAGERDVELRFPERIVLNAAEGNCLDRDGLPIAGVKVGLLLQVTYGVDGHLERPSLGRTDAQGRFKLKELRLGPCWGQFESPKVESEWYSIGEEEIARAGSGPLVFSLNRTTQLRFVPSGVDPTGCRVGLSNAEGLLVTLWVFAKNKKSFDLTWSLEKGASPFPNRGGASFLSCVAVK
jgi:hypothetical protein